MNIRLSPRVTWASSTPTLIKKFTARSGVGVLKSDNDAYVVDASEQAELMNKYFSTTFTVDDNVTSTFPFSCYNWRRSS